MISDNSHRTAVSSTHVGRLGHECYFMLILIYPSYNVGTSSVVDTSECASSCEVLITGLMPCCSGVTMYTRVALPPLTFWQPDLSFPRAIYSLENPSDLTQLSPSGKRT